MIRLGVIGLSEGNGHPYSWPAIFNGYDPVSMECCGFPAIPRYLEKQRFPADAIAEAQVTHVWAQDPEVARHMASASKVENVVDRYPDMIGKVDGILLARDDAELHFEMAAPFLKAGMPIYIDKPIALSIAAANALFDLQRYPGQIFSCSALRYAKELQLPQEERQRLGRLHHIHATVPKGWDKYAIHAIEPMLLLAGNPGGMQRIASWGSGDASSLAVRFDGGLEAVVSAMGSCQAPIGLRVMGELGWKDLIFEDSFSAFKQALSEFVQGIVHRDVRIQREFVLDVIRIVECGRTS